jgi:ketosteroid isomerase-like protein
MSQENVDAMRRWLEAISSEDFDAALALVHPDIELVPPGGQPPYRGAESLRRWMEPDAFQDQVVTPVEIVVAAAVGIVSSPRLGCLARSPTRVNPRPPAG